MTEKSRTEYSARNTSIAMISRIIAILMGYVTRIVFTHTLSESYVGINGLFTDILNVLALSELGVGTALTYALYKPIAERDIERQKSLMRLFKWLYRCVAGLIAAAGLCVVPFLPYLVNDAGDVEHVTVIYLLYLLNSAVSYLLVYKKTLIDAHQRSYIGVLYHTVFLLIQYVLQIVILICTRNFILYLLIYLFCTVGNNVCVAKKADSLYPYLRDKDINPIPKEEKQGIIRNMKAMLMHKIGNVMVNNTDNILLTAMTGLVNAGKYSNYYLIIGSVRQVLDQAFQGITASVGNLGVTEDKSRVKKIFEASFFIGQWLYGFASICLFQLLNYIITFSFGENYQFPSAMVFVLCVNFFVTGMRQATLVFRDSLGLFWYDRYKSLAEAVINLVASVLLTLRFGIIGVFLGTFISTVLTSFWIEPYVLYKKKLESPVALYFCRYGIYTAVVLLAGVLTNRLCSIAGGEGFSALIIDFLICCFVPNIVFLLCYQGTKEFRFLCKKAVELLNKKLHKPAEAKSLMLTQSDENLLEVLKTALIEKSPFSKIELSEEEWDDILSKADRHAVLSLMYDFLSEQNLSENQMNFVTRTARKYVLQNYRLSYCTHQVTEKLNQQGISTAVLKGVSISDCYPVPELRKSGDIDILIIDAARLEDAKAALTADGFSVTEQQLSHHHLVMRHPAGIDVELHTMLAEPFDNSEMNRYLENCLLNVSEHILQRNIMGYDASVLDDGYQAYEILLHMLQHFLRSGFGLKLLCDWVLFWNRDISEEDLQQYLKMVRESGLGGFSKMITSVCVKYLGLDKNCCLCRHISLLEDDDTRCFMADLLEAEEFGKSSRDRMVALRGTSLFDYFREFHHEMHLNFPKAGKVFIFWPVLWSVTLFRFLKNNRKIRKVTAREIFKKAGERSQRIGKLRLFSTKDDGKKN